MISAPLPQGSHQLHRRAALPDSPGVLESQDIVRLGQCRTYLVQGLLRGSCLLQVQKDRPEPCVGISEPVAEPFPESKAEGGRGLIHRLRKKHQILGGGILCSAGEVGDAQSREQFRTVPGIFPGRSGGKRRRDLKYRVRPAAERRLGSRRSAVNCRFPALHKRPAEQHDAPGGRRW